MAAIQSVDWVPQFSDDGGTTWQTLVCPTSWTLSGSSEVTKTSTLTCGVLSAPGAFGLEGTADSISKADPDSDEVSVKQALEWANAGTALKFKASSGVSGADLFLAGDAQISSVDITAEADNYVTFSIGWTIENIDIVP
jgi:hypothetical protein